MFILELLWTSVLLLAVVCYSMPNRPDPCQLASLAYAQTKTAFVPAQMASDCLSSVPLNKTEAHLQFAEVRKFLQFYSAQAFWKTPPRGRLGQKAFDVNEAIDAVASGIADGLYESTLDLDHALTDAFGSLHDGHTTYATTLSSAFVFLHEYPLVSIATSPKNEPEVHLGDAKTGAPLIEGEVALINNVTPSEYLTTLAESSPLTDWIDLDARYNSLMIQRVRVGQATSPIDNLGIFAGRDRLPPEPLHITLSNGSHIDIAWKAAFNWFKMGYMAPPLLLLFNNTENFKTYGTYPGEDIGHRSQIGSEAVKMLEDAHGNDSLFFQPIEENVAIREISNHTAAYYILDDSIGVLRVSAFQGSYLGAQSPLESISDMTNLTRAALSYFKQRRIKRVLIDVSRNTGGNVAAGYSMFRQFFPAADPYYGQDMRWSPALEALVQYYSNLSTPYGSIFDYHFARQKNGSEFINAEGFLGPVRKANDSFTKNSRADDKRFIEADSLYHVALPESAPFAASDVALLSDSLCGSTCASFAEAMQDQGVRGVVYGGRPSRTTMQVSGGTKGGYHYSYNSFVRDSQRVRKSNMTEGLSAGPMRYQTSLGVNLANAYSPRDDDVPLEFQYREATHTMQLTAKMAGSTEERWRMAAQKVWG